MKLSNGVVIPDIGLGTWAGRAERPLMNKDNILDAIRVGYRLIDTATRYENEDEIGEALEEAFNMNLVSRDEMFITSKVWNNEQGYENTLCAFYTSLEKLKLEYLDLYLIHWPKGYDQTLDTWRALEHLYSIGKVRAIGVSNFAIHHLEHLIEEAKIIPMVNQVESHIELQNHRLRAFCDEYHIVMEAYGPLMSFKLDTLLSNPTLIEIASKHGCTVAQVALAYNYSMNVISLPKSKSINRLTENLNSLKISLTDDEIKQLRSLNRGLRIFADADNFDQ